MCLFRRGSCKVADKDIIVYKVVSSNLKSQYYEFQYEIGKSYNKKWTKDFIDYCEHHDTIGGNTFHSSLSKDDAVWLYGSDAEIVIEDGKELKISKLSESQILLKCIVPAGTKYFEGTFSEVASEQIIIKEICV